MEGIKNIIRYLLVANFFFFFWKANDTWWPQLNGGLKQSSVYFGKTSTSVQNKPLLLFFIKMWEVKLSKCIPAFIVIVMAACQVYQGPTVYQTLLFKTEMNKLYSAQRFLCVKLLDALQRVISFGWSTYSVNHKVNCICHFWVQRSFCKVP